jgi:hypothetical protein
LAEIRVYKTGKGVFQVLVKKTRHGENPSRALLDVPKAQLGQAVGQLFKEVRNAPHLERETPS